MAVFSEPTKWAQALGATANADVIPDEAGAMDVDISKIFPAVFSVPLAQGGKAIPRRTLNGIFKTLGDWAFYNQNGGVPSYNADFDYTVGRFVSCNGGLYKCIQDNTHTAPHKPTDKDYWAELSDSSSSAGLLPNQIIISPVPMSDANLHLLDGSLLTSGVYAEYVEMMIELYNADPTASCWTTESNWQASVTLYGECGKFVVDTVNETVRLPKLTSFIQATSTANELGSLTEAGLPNIEGKAGPEEQNSMDWSQSGCFWYSDGIQSGLSGGSAPFGAAYLNFDASLSNSIYGKSATVQPQSIKYYYYIVVGTVSKTPIQVDIDNVATDLNGKADKDFSNVSNAANILMAHNAMPSNNYVDLTVGATESTYTAPADGYFAFFAYPCSFVGLGTKSLTYNTTSYSLNDGNNRDGGVFLPVKKGQTVIYRYASNVQIQIIVLRFIYAQGAVLEAN